jgi:hypothetical protein
MISRRVYPPLWLAFTMILAGYLMVWLPQPVVGLSLMGLEMGEWVKFLPQVQAGSLPDRNLFYLPPITLSLMVIIWTAGWPNRRWQTWAARCLAILVSLLAFPAVEAIRFEPADQWSLRLFLIAMVIFAAVASALAHHLPAILSPLLLLFLAGLGGLLPIWAYLVMRPVIAQLLRTEIGIGPGIWFTLGGQLLVVVVSLLLLLRPIESE